MTLRIDTKVKIYPYYADEIRETWLLYHEKDLERDQYFSWDAYEPRS